MTLPRLNGLWDEVGESFMDFSKKLPGMLNPNAEYLKKVREQLALNPQLLQQYMDAEQLSPGTLERLGLGGMAQQARATPASSNVLKERMAQQELNTPLTTDEKDQVRAGILGTKDSLSREKQRADLEATRASTKYTISNTALTDLEKQIKEATAAGDIASATMNVNKLATYNNAKTIVDEINKAGQSPFKLYLDGKLGPEQLSSIRAVPEFASAWESEFAVWKEKQDQEEAKKNRAVEYYRINQNGAEEELNKQRARLAQAIALFNGGSIDDVMAYQKLDAQKKLQLESFKDRSQVPPELANAYNGMLSSKNYQAKMVRKEIQSQFATSSVSLQKALDLATKGKNGQEKLAGVNTANYTLRTIYTPLVEQGLVKNVPQIGYKPGTFGGVKDVFWTNSDQEAMDAVNSLGYNLAGETQAKVNKATSSTGTDSVDYESIANDVVARSGKDAGKIEQEIMLAAQAVAGLDKTKLRAAIARKRGSKK